jgi:amino acid transporter
MQQGDQQARAGAHYIELAAAASGTSGLRTESPVAGLERRRLRPLQVLGQSVSTAAPTAAISVTPAIAAATAGAAATWSFLIATGLALLIGTSVNHFTRRMAAAGSLYTLTARGLGPIGGLACGAALLIGYGFLAMTGLVGSASYLTALLARLGAGGVVTTGGITALITLLLGLAATMLIRRGVRLSAGIVLTVETVSITLIVLISILLLAQHGTPTQAVQPPPLHWRDIAAGTLPALGAFIGFEAAAALGVEARRPFSTIPRVVRWTAAGCGLLYLFASYTQHLEFAGAPGGLAAQHQPLNTLAAAQHLPWLSDVLDIGIALSFFAAALAASTALVRVLFSMGRENIAPTVAGRTHPRHRTPHITIAVAVPVIALVPALLLAIGGMTPAAILTAVLNTAVFGYLIAYLLVCAAAPVFLRRIGELTPGAVLASAATAPILLLALGFFIASQWGSGIPLVWLVLALAGLGWFAWLRLTRPRELATIGIYDETSTNDLLGGPGVDADP